MDAAALDSLLVRVFGERTGFDYRRTETGTSTQVYRLRRGGETFYVRIGETEQDAMAPEAAAHASLREAGVAVPAVVHLEPFDRKLERSVLVTTEVPGRPAGDLTVEGTALAEIYRSAGRDLARLHHCPVRGFGFVLRDHGGPGWPVRAEFGTYAEFVDPTGTVAGLADSGLDTTTLGLIEQLLAEDVERGPENGHGRLAHGDLDPTHVFTDGHGYTGLIDFGEIRGTAYSFDFATMWLESTAKGRTAAYHHLERGYADVTPLPDDHERRVHLACVHSVASRTARWLRRDGPGALDGPYLRRLLAQLSDLVGPRG